MLDLITDQRKLLKLAFVLSVDIDFLVETIRSDPLTLNYKSRTQFIQGILDFLKEAIGLKELQNHLSNAVDQKATTTAQLIIPTRACLSPVIRLVEPARVHPPPITAPASATILVPHLSEKPRGNHLLISGVPFGITSSVFLQQIHGGPLESLLRRAKHDSQNPATCSFVVKFLEPDAAEAFLTFTTSPVGRLHFPGAGEISISWCHRGDSHLTYVLKAAKDLVNPARRVLIFDNYPLSTMSKGQMEHRLQTLDKGFLPCGHYSVDDYEIALSEKKARLVFNCIGAALKVMELHRSRLLGAEFAYCEIVYGRDPADRPIPGQTVSRALIFYEYFGEASSKDELKRRLQVLEKKFLLEYSVDEHQIDYVGRKAFIVFNRIEAAEKVMECYKLRLLGFPFDNCRVNFGMDIRPTTVSRNNALAQSQTPATKPPVSNKAVLSPIAATTPAVIVLSPLELISFNENQHKAHVGASEVESEDSLAPTACPFGVDIAVNTPTLTPARASNALSVAPVPTSASSRVPLGHSPPSPLSQLPIHSEIWLQAFDSEGSI